MKEHVAQSAAPLGESHRFVPPWIAIPLVVAAGGLLSSGAPAVAAETAVVAPKTLTRSHDPVIVVGAELVPLLGHPVEQFRLYGFRSGAFEVIPHQVEARDERGEIVFGDPNAERRAIGPRDELVFMARDAGDRAEPRGLPPDADAAWEIELIDSVGGERGWVYLLHFGGKPPPLSPVRYAAFDPETNEARGWYYSVRYAPERNYYTSMRILPGPGRSGPELLSRMQIRIEAAFSLVFATWRPEFTEEDFTARVDGVKNGPVRAVRRVRQSLDMGRFFPDVPSGRVYSSYYFSSFVTPTTLSLPWPVFHSLRQFEFRGINDFRPEVMGMTYHDGANSQGLRYRGQPPAELDTTTDHEWWAISGEAGTCVHVFEIPDEWKEWGIVRGTVFIDTADDAASQGATPISGTQAAGYHLSNLGNVQRHGEFELTNPPFRCDE